MWSCPNCGEPIGDEWGVCWICGTTPEGTKDPRFRPEPVAEPPSFDESGPPSVAHRRATLVFLAVLLGSLVVCWQFGGSVVTFLWMLVAGNLFSAGIGLVITYLLRPQGDDEEQEAAYPGR